MTRAIFCVFALALAMACQSEVMEQGQSSPEILTEERSSIAEIDVSNAIQTPLVVGRGDTAACVVPGRQTTVIELGPSGTTERVAILDLVEPSAAIAEPDGSLLIAGWFGADSRTRAREDDDEAVSWIGRYVNGTFDRLVTLRNEAGVPVRIRDIARLTDGSVVGVGRIASMAGVVVQLSPDLNSVRSRVVDLAGNDDLVRVVPVDDGYVILGVSNDLPLLISHSVDGESRWAYLYRCCWGEVAGLTRTTDGGFLIAGSSGSGDREVTLLRVDGAGKGVSGVRLGTDYTDYAFDVRMAPSGSSLVSAATRARPSGPYRLWMLEVSEDGEVLWDYAMAGDENDVVANQRFVNATTTGDDRWIVATAPGRTGGKLWMATVPLRSSRDASWRSNLATKRQTFVPAETRALVEVTALDMKATPEPIPRASTRALSVVAGQPNPVEGSGPPKDVGAAPAGQGPAAEIRRMMAVSGDLLVEKRFDLLDALADRLRSSRETFASGEQKLYFFYEGLSTENSALQHLGNQGIFELVMEWRKARPDSLTARIAAASTLVDAAFEARGTGLAHTVTESSWRNVHALIDRARAELEGWGGKIDDPHYYAELIFIANDSGQDIWPAFTKGTALDPEYYYLYNFATMYSVRKWGGSPDRVRAVARRGVELTEKRLGRGIEARVAWTTFLNTGDDFAYYDWQDVQRAFDDWMYVYPESDRAMHRLGMMACRYKDRRVAREVFVRPDINWETGGDLEWSHELFDACRAWALSERAAKWMDPPLNDAEVSMAMPPVQYRIVTKDPSIERATRRLGEWLRPDASRWPLLVRRLNAWSEGTRMVRFAATLVNAPRGPVAVVVIPHGMDMNTLRWEIDSTITSAPPQWGVKRIHTDGAPFAIRHSIPYAEVLNVATEDAAPGDKVYVLFESGGQQDVAVGYVRSAYAAASGKGTAFDGILEARKSYPDLLGSPVLTEDGELMGLVIHYRQTNEGAHFFSWQTVRSIVESM